MDIAFNKKTGEFVNAFRIYHDGAYQNIDPKEWVAPRDDICNWNELEKLNILEVPVRPRKQSIKIINGIKKIIRRPCFAKLPNHPGKTISDGESKEHKLIKNFIVEKIMNDELEFNYSTIIGDDKKINSFKVSEMDMDIYNYKLLERTIQSSKNTRADILIPFKSRHKLFGEGIIIEIQLSNQADIITINRTIERATQGYSVAWIFKKEIEEIEECLFLKNNNIKLRSFSEIIDNDFPNKISNLVEEQCRYLNDKLVEFDTMNVMLIKDYKEIENKIKEHESWKRDALNDKCGELHERLDSEEGEFELKIDNKICDFENKWDDIKSSIDDTTKELISINIDEYLRDELPSITDKEVLKYLDKFKSNINEFMMDKLDEKISPIINNQVDNIVKETISKKIKELDLSKIIIDNKRIMDAVICKKCGKEMRIGKAMSGYNWYCEDFPYCDSIIKGCDKNDRG